MHISTKVKVIMTELTAATVIQPFFFKLFKALQIKGEKIY